MSVIDDLKTCPHCGEKTLEFSQNADIRFALKETTLAPILSEDSIGWMDSTSLYCSNCGSSDDDSDEVSHMKHEYDKRVK